MQRYRFETVTRVREEAISIPTHFLDKITTYQVSQQQLDELSEQTKTVQLVHQHHKGEFQLWAHANSLLHDNWLLCGPDHDLIQIACALRKEDKVVSVEKLLRDVGLDKEADELISTRYNRHLSQAWLNEKIHNILSSW